MRQAVAESLELRTLLSAFIVTSTAEEGVGSSRQAIQDANGNPGADEIHVDINGMGVTIGGFGATPASMTGRGTIQNDDAAPDLYGGTIGSASAIAPGMYTESIEPADDVDMFAVTVEAGQTWTFDIDLPDGTLALLLRLFDANGSQLASNAIGTGPDPEYSPAESFLLYSFASAGTFYAGVSASLNSGYDPETGEFAAAGDGGPYMLTVAQLVLGEPGSTLLTARPVGLPASIDEQISPAGDVDLYRFTVSAGETIAFDVDVPNGWWYPVLRLFDSDGWELAANWGDVGPAPEYIWPEPFIEYTFSDAGTYYVGISTDDNVDYDPVDGSGINDTSDTGDYRLILQAIPPQFRMEEPIYSMDENGTAWLSVKRIGTQGTASVDYTITGLTAESGVNFAAAGGTLYFGDGQDIAEILVSAIDNSVVSPDRTLRVDLANPSSGYRIDPGAASAGIFILDNDGNTTATLYCPDVAAPEGTGPDATVVVMMYFSRIAPSSAFGFELSDGTAINSYDYYTSGGSTGGDFWYEYAWDLPVNGDIFPEPDEYFFLAFNSATNLNLGNTGPVQITLLDDDSSGGVEPGNTLATARIITVGDTINEFIRPEDDVDLYAFTPAMSGQMVRMRVSTTSWISLYMRVFDSAGAQLQSGWDQIDYTFWDPNQTYYLGVSAWPNTSYNPVTGEDAVPASEAGDYLLEVLDRMQFPPDVYAGNTLIIEPATGQETMLVSLDLGFTWPESLDIAYRTQDNPDAAKPATAGLDYEATSGIAHFEPGESHATFAITVYADSLEERAEQFHIIITQPGGQEWWFSGQIVPPDMDDQISEAMPLDVGTPASGTLEHGIDVNMHAFEAMAGQTLDFDMDRAEVNGVYYSRLRLFKADGTPLAISDYGTHFGPGEPASWEPRLHYTFADAGTCYVGVSGLDDDNYDAVTGENDALSYWTGNYTLLVTDSTLPTVSIGSAAAPAGSHAVVFTVSLSHAYNPDVLVDFTTADGSALAGVDYALTTGTLSFAPGQTSLTITVPILAASLDAKKTFTVILSNGRSQVYVGVGLPWADTAVPIDVPNGAGTIQAGSGPANQVTGTPGPDQYSVVVDTSANLLRVFKSLNGSGELAQAFSLDVLTSIHFATGGDDDTVVIFGLPAGIALSFNGGDGNDTLIVRQRACAIGAGAAASVENFVADDGAAVDLDVANAFSSLSIAGNATVRLTGAARTFGCASISIDGTLDLGSHELIISPPAAGFASQLEQLNNWVRSARNATPLWSSPGITSSVAAADPLRGVAILPLPAQGQILVKCTLNGDVDGNGGLDGDDYFLMDAAFLAGLPNPGWSGGNVNYDQVMDGADYLLADAAFLGQPVPISVSAAAAPIRPAALSPFRSSGPLTNEDVRPDDEDAWDAGATAVYR